MIYREFNRALAIL
ncbi:hypothetical protein N4741_12910 [Escherichia coli]|nr:hypothetical protein [Escherichia coli]MCS0887417.1 hypothetical protein [Escherichia coli]MCU6849454.1 hypothetical protein [Escherichia coli]MCU7043652.1 hypothetical protein [Escherichia coli]